MPDRRAVILLRPRRDYRVDISLIDPATGRESRTGLTAGPRQDDIDRQVKKIKEQLERSGSHVEVRGV